MPLNKNPFKNEAAIEVTTSDSLINTYSVEAQNKRLYEHLAAGNTINFLQARDLSIGFVDSRIAELRKQKMNVHSRFIRIRNVKCKEYSLKAFDENGEE